MACLRELHRFKGLNSMLILDLQRTAGLLYALRSVSTCLLRSQTSSEVLKIHKITISHRHRCFSSRQSSELDSKHADGYTNVRRIIPKTSDEIKALSHSPYEAPSDARILKVSIIGAPNAGKSTLTNALMGWRICSVSKKVHTTTHNTKAVLVKGNTQILFMDTPGLISEKEKKKHNLELSMLKDPKLSMQKADLVIVLVDASNKWTRHRLDPEVLQLLQDCTNKKVVLVLNKVDLVRSKKLLLEIVRELTAGNVDGQSISTIKSPAMTPKTLEEILEKFESTFRDMEQDKTDSEKSDREEPEPSPENVAKHPKLGPGWPHFGRIFMLSALQEDGITELKDYLFEQAKNGLWMYNPSYVTDQKPEEIAILAVREKLLDCMPKEIPYNLKLEIELWEVDEFGFLRISMIINCPERNHVKLVIGAQGAIIRKVAEDARQVLMNTFRCEVSLKLIVNDVRSSKKK